MKKNFLYFLPSPILIRKRNFSSENSFFFNFLKLLKILFMTILSLIVSYEFLDFRILKYNKKKKIQSIYNALENKWNFIWNKKRILTWEVFLLITVNWRSVLKQRLLSLLLKQYVISFLKIKQKCFYFKSEFLVKILKRPH